MKAIIIALGIIAPFFSYAQSTGRLVDSCYAATDSDLSGFPEGTKISIKVYQVARNKYSAQIEQTVGDTGQVLQTQFPVQLQGSRALPSWHYSNNERGFLNIYRTNKSERNPTTFNAHMRLWVTDGTVFGIDRLECQAL